MLLHPKISLPIILIFLVLSCSVTNTNKDLYKSVSINSLFGESKNQIEGKYKIILEDEFGYLHDEEKYLGSSYANYIFIFQNNKLAHIADSSESYSIWLNHSRIFHTPPFSKGIAQIHSKLFSLPIYNSEPVSVDQHGEDSSTSNSDLGDKLAAGTMLILALPIMPILYGEKYQMDKARDLDWIQEVLGSPLEKVEEILGTPKRKRDLTEMDTIVGFVNPKSQWGAMTNYVGTSGDRVIWALKSNPYLLD